MFSRRFIIFLLLTGFTAFIPACGIVPYSGRSQMIMTTVEEENKLGDEAWKEVLETSKLSSSTLYTSAVDRTGKAIAEAARNDAPGFQWEFKLIEDQQANAFCLPGGKIAVYSGLFDFADNDAELAAVIGHEVGHAIARHGGERMSHDLVRDAGGAILSSTAQSDAVLAAYGIGTTLGASLPYSRAQEYEADYIGLILMAKAGYDPQSAITFWEKFSKVGSKSKISAFLSTHPLGAERIKRMNRHMQEALDIYNALGVKKKNKGYLYRVPPKAQTGLVKKVAAPAVQSKTQPISTAAEKKVKSVQSNKKLLPKSMQP